MTDLLTLSAARRWDIYGPVHKGLRRAHGAMAMRLGAADYGADLRPLLDDLRAHLEMAAQHLTHEEDHIHAALTARAPEAVAELGEQHEHHRARFAALTAAIARLEHGERADRPGLGRLLYLEFSAYVAEDFLHMLHEETVTWPLLCDLFSDDELMAIEQAIIASLSPEETIATMRMMLPAMNPAERTGLLTGMKAGAPPQAYAAVIEHAARPTLPLSDFAELQRLGLAA
jgi:iron-sulfur cluster repair protein YtfE (RIC family)